MATHSCRSLQNYKDLRSKMATEWWFLLCGPGIKWSACGGGAESKASDMGSANVHCKGGRLILPPHLGKLWWQKAGLLQALASCRTCVHICTKCAHGNRLNTLRKSPPFLFKCVIHWLREMMCVGKKCIYSIKCPGRDTD